MPSNECSSPGGAGFAGKAGHDWNAWSAIGKADRPICKTFNLIRLHEPSSYIDDAPQDEDSSSGTEFFPLNDTDDPPLSDADDADDSSSDPDSLPDLVTFNSDNNPSHIIFPSSDVSDTLSEIIDSSSDDMDDSPPNINNLVAESDESSSQADETDDSSSDDNNSPSDSDGSSSDEDIYEEDTLESQWWQQVPSVPAITGLLLRQQTRRQWSPRTLQAMFNHLPGLQEVIYEPWIPVDSQGRVATNKGK